MTMRIGMALLGVCLGGAAATARGPGREGARGAPGRARAARGTPGSANDQAKLQGAAAPDAVTISAGTAEWHDLEGVAEVGRRLFRDRGQADPPRVPRTEVQAYGDTAFVYSLYEFDLDGPQGKRSASGRATEIFVKQDGRWIHPGWHLDSGQ